MQPAIAERGLVVLDCVTTGVTGHAARSEGINAIYRAMADIEALRSFRFPDESQILGPVGLNITRINAGWQHNAIPDECKWVVDIRTTDAYTNEETVSLLRTAVSPHSSLTPRSTRVRASVISSDHPLVSGAIGLGTAPFVSPTTSDMSLMYDIPPAENRARRVIAQPFGRRIHPPQRNRRSHSGLPLSHHRSAALNNYSPQFHTTKPRNPHQDMKLWSKGFEPDKMIEEFTVGRDRELDLRPARYDVEGSMAHIRMLESIGLLKADELEVLLKALGEIAEVIERGEFTIEPGVEDVHSQVEFMLTAKLGDVGKKIHSGRSRNDQVLVDLKLFMRDELRRIADAVSRLFKRLQSLSEEYKDVLMPGYTHLQVAMPSSFGLSVRSLCRISCR